MNYGILLRVTQYSWITWSFLLPMHFMSMDFSINRTLWAPVDVLLIYNYGFSTCSTLQHKLHLKAKSCKQTLHVAVLWKAKKKKSNQNYTTNFQQYMLHCHTLLNKVVEGRVNREFWYRTKTVLKDWGHFQDLHDNPRGGNISCHLLSTIALL